MLTAPRVSSGSWVVQVAARPTESAARAAALTLIARHRNVLGGYEPQVVKAEIDGKGTWYRARVAAGSEENARKLCANLKAVGEDCFVQRD